MRIVSLITFVFVCVMFAGCQRQVVKVPTPVLAPEGSMAPSSAFLEDWDLYNKIGYKLDRDKAVYLLKHPEKTAADFQLLNQGIFDQYNGMGSRLGAQVPEGKAWEPTRKIFVPKAVPLQPQPQPAAPKAEEKKPEEKKE